MCFQSTASIVDVVTVNCLQIKTHIIKNCNNAKEMQTNTFKHIFKKGVPHIESKESAGK
jgi:hypothetical protein